MGAEAIRRTARLRGSLPGGPLGRLSDPWALALVIALLVHLILLGPIVLNAVRDAADAPMFADLTDTSIPIDLMPSLPRRTAPIPRPSSLPADALPGAPRPHIAPVSPPGEAAPGAVSSIPVETQGPAVSAPTDAPQRQRIAEALSRAAACRNLAADLSIAEQAACDRRRPSRREAVALNDPAQARFAAEGAAQLAAYEALRAPLRPPSEETRLCPHATDPMGRCPVQLNIPLFSSRRGFLPGLKKDED